jgi:phosphoribosylaminoimidazole-succinocarboxamide synthase
MPDGMEEYDSFPEPIITPTTKAQFGHDEDLTEVEILTRRLATADEWQQLKQYMRALFERGQKMARDQGLVLADTKYEFGRLNGKLILIDEIHTPDSSRYFYADSYDAYVSGKKDKQDGQDERERPRQLSKEFVREWLMERGFSGQVGETMPEITDDFVSMVSERYIELYEKLTGKKFKKTPAKDATERVETSIKDYLEANKT